MRPTIGKRKRHEGPSESGRFGPLRRCLDGRPTRVVAEEMLLRLVLLNKFRGHLAEEGNNFLTPRQRERLERFAARFSDNALKFAEQRLRRLKIELTAELDRSCALWQLDETA